LPEGIRIRSWIEVAGSSLRQLPWSLRLVRVLCRGVPVPDRIAFDPESIGVDEILREQNATMQRVLLDRVGLRWFLDQANASIVDVDQDAGGQRRLLRVRLDGNEDIVCVEERCPSTGGVYLLRVPPAMQSCRQAVAWTAGYISPDAYKSIVES
jgi:hypothetical protein